MQNSNKKQNRILVSGLNWSGSGTVVGLLREYEGVVQIPGSSEETAPAGYKKLGEFEDFRGANLVGDHLLMEKNLIDPNAILLLAKKRRKLHIPFSFIQSIMKVKTFRQIRESISLHKQLFKLSKSYLQLAIDLQLHDNFEYRLQRAYDWINEITNICSEPNGDAVVFDQPIHLGLQSKFWPEVFKPFKLVIVYRDPRDVFAEQANKYYLFREQMDPNIRILYGESFDDALRYRIDTTLARMEAVDKVLSDFSNDEVMLISFEQMVKEYDFARKKIEDFVGLDSSKHIHPKMHFDPGWSIRNIGVNKNCAIKIPEETLEPLMKWYNDKLLKYPL